MACRTRFVRHREELRVTNAEMRVHMTELLAKIGAKTSVEAVTAASTSPIVDRLKALAFADRI